MVGIPSIHHAREVSFLLSMPGHVPRPHFIVRPARGPSNQRFAADPSPGSDFAAVVNFTYHGTRDVLTYPTNHEHNRSRQKVTSEAVSRHCYLSSHSSTLFKQDGML